MRARQRTRAALLLLALVACGKRGDPRPPLPTNPQHPASVTIAQRGDRLEIRVQAPRSTTGGVPLGVMEIEQLRMDTAGDFEKGAQRARTRAAPGEVLLQGTALPAPGTVVRVGARAIAGGKESIRTALTALTVRAPLPPPTALAATLGPTGATLTWVGALPAPAPTPTTAASPLQTEITGKPGGFSAPGASPAPAVVSSPAASASPAAAGASPAPSPSPTPPPTSGFWVYRHERGEPGDKPLMVAPLQVNTYLDPTPKVGETWCYDVRAVASTDPVIESAPSNEACISVTDTVAPPAPTGLLAVPREDGVELSWTALSGGDVAKLVVVRVAGDGAAERVATIPVSQSTWRDTNAPAGVLLRYTLLAADASGNESPPSTAAEARR